MVNPEFLREGLAYQDTAQPWRIIIGSDDPNVARRLINFYKRIYSSKIPLVKTDFLSAELIKLSANLYLSHRLAFIHEIAEYARSENLDIDIIREGIGLDPRIGTEYFNPGLGFGGSCLPKDCHLINSEESIADYQFQTAFTALGINNDVLENIINRLKSEIKNLKGKKITILGASFKAELNDTRNSRSVELAKMLKRRGAKVFVHEPFLPDSDSIVDGHLKLTPNIDEAVANSHAIIIGAAHRQFKDLKPEHIGKLVKKKLVIDNFRHLDKKKWTAKGFRFI